jgi:ABC-2 type transport system permease protein
MRSQLLLTWELARKDLHLFLADRRAVLLCFAVPIVLGSIFGAIFHRPGASGSLARVPLLLVVEDDSPLTGQIVQALETSDKVQTIRADRQTALHRLAQQCSGVVLVLPRGLGRMIDWDRPSGEKGPRIELLYHPASTLQSGWAEGVFTEIALRESAAVLLAPLLASGTGRSWERPFTIERLALTGPLPERVNSYCHSFCGMSVQYLLFWGMDCGLLLLREQRQGTWRRIRTAPVSLAALVGGKGLATAIVALSQIAVTFLFGYLAFGVTVAGSPVGFVVMALAAALLSAATGLLVAALGGTEARARSVAILAILSLSLLGGLWLPAFMLPGWVQQLGLVLPTTWAVRGLEGVVWQGMGLRGALRCALILLSFCAAFLIVAWWRLACAESAAIREGSRT